MTAVPEGEHELNKNNNKNKNNDNNNSTYDHNKTPRGEVDKNGDDELIKFLSSNDLLDMVDEILSSKLKLKHFREVEKSDLDDLCNDLKLTSPQKIRLKHSIKSLQKKIKRDKMTKKIIKIKSKKSKMKNGISDNIKNKMHKYKEYKNIKKNKRSNPEKPSSNKKKSKSKSKKILLNENENELNDVRYIKNKIVIVGQAGVGKSTLQKSMMGWEFEPGSKATFAVNSIHKKSKFKYKKLEIKADYEIFDTPGLDRFADIITLYLRGALCVIVVYDVINKESFKKAKWWIEYLENNASGYDKIILIANKIDVKGGTKGGDADNDNNDDNDNDDDSKNNDESKNNDNDDDNDDGDDDEDDEDAGFIDDDIDEIIKKGQLYATEHGIAFLEISAKNKDNISILLSWIDKMSKRKIIKNPQIIEKQQQNIKLHEANSNGNGNKFAGIRCCGFV